jgi:sugar phosphate isomerase/epimerase
MSDWPIGMSTGCFYHTSIFDCLEPIRAGGFSMLEICSSKHHLDYHDLATIDEVSRRLIEDGLEAYSFHAPFSPNIDITSLDQGHREHSKQELLLAAEAAAHLGVRFLVIHPGPEESLAPPPAEHLRRLQNAADVLEVVSQRCHELRIGIVLENMLPHLLFGNMRDMLWIMGAIANVNVGTCLDTGHAHLTGEVYNVLYKLSGHLQMIHANDNRGTYDDHLPPGEGQIDWRRMLTELSELDFRGARFRDLTSPPGADTAEFMRRARIARRDLRAIARDLALSSPPTVHAPHLESLG